MELFKIDQETPDMGLRAESLGGGGHFSWTSWIPPRDPRTADWPFIGNLPFVLALTLGYCYIVKVSSCRVRSAWLTRWRENSHLAPLIALMIDTVPS